MTEKQEITKEMKIEEVIKKYPEAEKVFTEYGFHCLNCIVSSFESIEEGARAHGVDVEKLIEGLNKAIKE